MKKRLDLLLVEQGLVGTKSQARSLVKEGRVLLKGESVTKPGFKVEEDVEIELLDAKLYVGRGARKLEAVFDKFDLDVSGKVIADVGASTGGFTEFLLGRGARKVYAIDVGVGQLAERLRASDKVVNMEGVDVREIGDLGELVDLIVVDLSFISLKHVILHLRSFLKENGELLLLFKPQFEAGRGVVNKNGVIEDNEVRETLLKDFIRWLKRHSFQVKRYEQSMVEGKKGNVEYFILIA